VEGRRYRGGVLGSDCRQSGRVTVGALSVGLRTRVMMGVGEWGVRVVSSLPSRYSR